MVMNLKKAFTLTSSDHRLFRHARFLRDFFIKCSPDGELSYYIKKARTLPGLLDEPYTFIERVSLALKAERLNSDCLPTHRPPRKSG